MTAVRTNFLAEQSGTVEMAGLFGIETEMNGVGFGFLSGVEAAWRAGRRPSFDRF